MKNVKINYLIKQSKDLIPYIEKDFVSKIDGKTRKGKFPRDEEESKEYLNNLSDDEFRKLWKIHMARRKSKFEADCENKRKIKKNIRVYS